MYSYSMNRFTDILTHRWLKVPYTLHSHIYHNPEKYRETVILLPGLGNSSLSWKEIVSYIPKDTRVIALDLLGFGKSPKPNWAVYNTKTQARAVMKTILKHRLQGKIIVVGHSLGGLVAISLTTMFPMLVKRLILCSPPIYRPKEDGKILPSKDDRLRELYKIAKTRPDELKFLAPMAVKLGIVNKTLDINDKNIKSYLDTLELSIIKQTAIRDIRRIKIPITFFHGILDPLVVGGNLKEIAKERENVQYHSVLASHEVVGEYAKRLGLYLKKLLETSN